MLHAPSLANSPKPTARDARLRLRPRSRLTTRIALVASTLTLAFVIVVGEVSYLATRAQVTEHALAALDNHAALIAGRLGSAIGSVVSTLTPLSENALVLNSLMDSLTRETSLVPFLDDFSTVTGIPVETALVDFEGTPVAGDRSVVEVTRDWMRPVLADGKPYATVERHASGVFLLLANPILLMRTMSPEGALVHKITLPAEIFGEAEAGEHVRLLLDGEPILEQLSPAERPTTGDGTLARIRALDLPETLSALDLAVEVIAGHEVVAGPLERLFRIYALAAVALVTVAIVLSVAAAHRLTRPLRRLEDVASQVVQSGSFDHRFEVGEASEVAGLADAFNRMLERLGVAYEQLAQKAELESVRGQELVDANRALHAEVAVRKRAEADARDARQVLAHAIENLTDGFALYDDQRRLVLCNEPYRRMYPTIYDDLVPGAAFEEVTRKAIERGQFQKVLDGETGEPVERLDAWRENRPVEYLTREGRWLMARDRVTGDGGCVGVRIDITARKRAEEALRESEGRLTAIYNSANDGIFVLDPTRDCVVEANPRAAELLGYARDDLPGLATADVFPAGGGLIKAVARGEVAPGGGAMESLVARRRSGETVPVEMSTSRLQIAARSMVLAVVRDVTERQRAERALAEHAAELARSNAELEQFAYVASHDLQEPLRKVHAFSDLLEAECAQALDESGRDYLRRIRVACQRMQRLINDLLSFSRVSRDPGRGERVELTRIVEEVTSDLALRLAETGGRVEVGRLPAVMVDAAQLRQLLQNVIGNALKYSHPDVEPVVRVRSRTVEPDGAHDSAAGAPGRWCEVSVEDNGIGFEQKYASRVFGVFQRLHGVGEYPGTGIGLAICRKIVERYGGQIWAHSEPGIGTTIKFTLPLAEQVVPCKVS